MALCTCLHLLLAALLYHRRATFFPPRLRGLLFAACLFPVGGCASRSQTDGQATKPDGKALYTVNCASCHGEDGRNDRQGANRAMLLKKANALSDKEWGGLVQNGRGEMPAFYNRLSPQEIDALREYTRRLAGQ